LDHGSYSGPIFLDTPYYPYLFVEEGLPYFIKITNSEPKGDR
jgi:hypothetical protein